MSVAAQKIKTEKSITSYDCGYIKKQTN